VLEYYRDLAEQLAAMPGGHARLRQEYFATVTLPQPIHGLVSTSGAILEAWTLKEEGALALVSAESDEARLVWLRRGSEETIAEFTDELLEAVREYSIAPLGLALLALAMGSVKNGGRFKQLLPDVHKAGKGLLLIAVCRLCG
jgi:hypothetical protein